MALGSRNAEASRDIRKGLGLTSMTLWHPQRWSAAAGSALSRCLAHESPVPFQLGAAAAGDDSSSQEAAGPEVGAGAG